MFKRPIQLCSFIALLASTAVCHSGQESLTIYSKARPGGINPDLYRPTPWSSYRSDFRQIPGYGIVRHQRKFELNNEHQNIYFDNVAALIDPTTVHFSSLTAPQSTHVLEQNFLYDLVSQQKLLERYLGETLKVGSIEGRLLSFTEDHVLLGDDAGRIHRCPYPAEFPALPGGLITKPTLMWQIATKNTGMHLVEVSYQTDGMTWWADYNALFREDSQQTGTLDLSAWVSIINQSGATYSDAKLKLVAGDVQRIRTPDADPIQPMMAMAERMDGGKSFSEKAFFEYHLYTLSDPIDLPNNSTKQIELFKTALNVPVTKKLIYNGSNRRINFYDEPYLGRQNRNQSSKIEVFLAFKNAKNQNLGIPLPAGKIRVSQIDHEDDYPEFIGEDIIDHTPKDEQVLIKMGTAFDVVGERKEIDFKQSRELNKEQSGSASPWIEETIEIAVSNHKNQPVNVIIEETLHRWRQWDIITATAEYRKTDAQHVEFPVSIKPDGVAKVRYTVKYTW